MSNVTIIKAALFTPTRRGWGLPILFWGDPGVGKTDIIEGVARDFAMRIEVLSPGERGDGAFGVTPVPGETEGGMRIKYPAPDWVDLFADSDDRGIVFVDELTTAPPALQPALLGLIHARRVGGYQLPKGIRVLGACNPPEEAAGGWDIALPVANRFGHIPWESPSSGDWSDWLVSSDAEKDAISIKTNAAAEEKRVLDAFPSPFAKAKGIVSAFIKSRPELLHKKPKAGDPDGSRAWPSHRTWEMAVRALASAEVHGLSEEESDLFVSSFIGTATMTEFSVFRRANDLPDPAALLDGTITWKHDPARLDRTFAVVSACTSLIVPTNCVRRDERTGAFWDLVKPIANTDQDLLVPSVRPLAQCRATNHLKATPVLTKLRPVLDAAGIEIGG